MWEYLAGHIQVLGLETNRADNIFSLAVILRHPQETSWIIAVLAVMQVAGHTVVSHHDQELGSSQSK